nr:12075_t:CDS:10 [Entrophospora candida]CAG8585733.1 6589_t:CDS:10 [Entrophospora candida]
MDINENLEAQLKKEEAIGNLIKLDFPLYVNSIKLDGVKKTRRNFLEQIFNPILKARTLGSIIDEIQISIDKLYRLDIFENFDILLDTSNNQLTQIDVIDVLLSVEEKKRFFMKTGTEIGNDSGSANLSLNVRNLFGGAETLEAYMATSTQTSRIFQFCLATPINGNPDSKIDISAFRMTKSNQLYSSHDEILKGSALRWRGISKLGFHELNYGLIWRQICNINNDATLSIRESAGHSLKSSISHTFIYDKRDDIILPSSGYYFKLFQEVAGFGGDVNFIKNEIENQINYPLGEGFIFSASLRNGILYPLKDKSNISDRFFLGGAQSVRGFKLNGLGPREDKKDSLGGDIYLAGGISLFTPLPKLKKYPVKGHLFINGGSLIEFDSRRNFLNNFKNLTKTPSISAGIGIAYKSSILRFEINFCLPLIATASDKLKRFQLGLGINFW